MKRILLGIAGGTGSGKTTVARRIEQEMGADNVTIIPQDAYYRDRSDLDFEERKKLNYDHPDAFDNDLLKTHLINLKNGIPVEMPIYDYVLHLRRKETVRVEPGRIIILEGILALYDPEIRALMDIKIYVDTPDDIRFIRRLKRDIRERGRDMDSVIDQYLTTVRPMHLEFVEATKKYADIIIPEGGFNNVAINLVVLSLYQKLGTNSKGVEIND